MGDLAKAMRLARRGAKGRRTRASGPRGRVRVGARTEVVEPQRWPRDSDFEGDAAQPMRSSDGVIQQPQHRRSSDRRAYAPAPQSPPKPILPRRRASDALHISRRKRKNQPWAARAVLVERTGMVAEAFRHFAIRLRREMLQRDTRTVLVTSAVSGEGKTVTACNLAFALASMSADRRVALVDLDLRRAGMARALDVRPQSGMERMLWGESPLSSVCTPTDVAALDLFPVEAPRSKVHELLSGDRLRTALEELGRCYDTVVLDTPPVLLVPDVPLIAPHVGAIVPVARAGVTRRATFEEMIELLPGEKLVGTFLNERNRKIRSLSAYGPGDESEFGPEFG